MNRDTKVKEQAHRFANSLRQYADDIEKTCDDPGFSDLQVVLDLYKVVVGIDGYTGFGNFLRHWLIANLPATCMEHER